MQLLWSTHGYCPLAEEEFECSNCIRIILQICSRIDARERDLVLLHLKLTWDQYPIVSRDSMPAVF